MNFTQPIGKNRNSTNSKRLLKGLPAVFFLYYFCIFLLFIYVFFELYRLCLASIQLLFGRMKGQMIRILGYGSGLCKVFKRAEVRTDEFPGQNTSLRAVSYVYIKPYSGITRRVSWDHQSLL